MRAKQEYYEHVLQNRELAANPAIASCTCPNALCDWHGECKEYVALHRYHNDHVPFFLQPIIREKVRAIAATIEMELSPKQGTSTEYRHYV